MDLLSSAEMECPHIVAAMMKAEKEVLDPDSGWDGMNFIFNDPTKQVRFLITSLIQVLSPLCDVCLLS